MGGHSLSQGTPWKVSMTQLGLGGASGPAGVAAGLAVVPVAAQVYLQSQGAVGGGPVLAVLICAGMQAPN